LKILYVHQDEIFDSSELADYFNTKWNNYDSKGSGLARKLEKKGFIQKELRGSFVGYRINDAGIKYFENVCKIT
jgi:hypothetical protein